MAKRSPMIFPLMPALLMSATLIVASEARAEHPSATPQAAAQPAPAAAPAAPAPAEPPPAAPPPEAPPAPPPPAAPPGAYPYAPYAYPPYWYPPPPGWQPAPPPAPPLRFDSAAEVPPDDEGLYEPGRRRRDGEDTWIPRSSSKPNTGKAGGILIGVGLGLAALGGVLTAVAAAGSGGGGSEFSRGISEKFFLPVGVTTMVTGGVTLLVGIPLYAVSR